MNRLFSRCAVVLLLSAAIVALRADTITVAGQARTYVLYAPAGLSNPPLVINMHGLTGTGSQQRSYTRMDRIADRELFIVVYPDGLDNTWDISGNKDVDFITTLIDTLYTSHGIDRNRVYATGFSMGGYMSHRLGCVIPDKIAAIAPVSGLMGYSRNCSTARPLPVLQIHGTADSTVKYSGVAATISGWVSRNGCPATSQVTKPYPSTNPNSVVTREYYGPCNQQSEVVLLSLEGVGHAWPSNTTTQINASEEIWAFFKNHSLNGAEVTASGSLPVSTLRPGAFFSAGKVRLTGIREIKNIRILNAQGREVMMTGSPGHTFSFNKNAAGVYLLMIEVKNGRIPVRLVVH